MQAEAAPVLGAAPSGLEPPASAFSHYADAAAGEPAGGFAPPGLPAGEGFLSLEPT